MRRDGLICCRGEKPHPDRIILYYNAKQEDGYDNIRCEKASCKEYLIDV